MDYVTTCLIHKKSKRKKEHQGDDVAMMLHQGKKAINFHSKISKHATIVANQTTLYNFAIKHIKRTMKMITIPREMMPKYL